MKTNRTVDRAINMLEIISKHQEGLSLNDICAKMEIPKSSCFDILHTLVNAKMIESIGRDLKIYRVGIKTFVIGNQYIESKQVVDVARSKMEKLGDKYAKSVFLGEDNLNHVIYVHKYQPKTSHLVASCTIGTITEYYNTALGKCILAFRNDCMDIIEKFHKDGKILDIDGFYTDVINIRKNKYVFSNQEHQKQLFCVAVPVFDHRGIASHALSLSGLYVNDSSAEKEKNDLQELAREISRELGFVG